MKILHANKNAINTHIHNTPYYYPLKKQLNYLNQNKFCFQTNKSCNKFCKKHKKEKIYKTVLIN